MEKIKSKIIVSFLFITLFYISSSAQTTKKIQKAKQVFKGTWVNKQTNRHINISFDYKDYVLINDWVGEYKNAKNIDAYKAFVDGNKLLLLEDQQNGSIHAPCCEITVQDGTLLYRCKASGYINAKNNFINNIPFVKEKKRNYIFNQSNQPCPISQTSAPTKVVLINQP